MNDSELALLRRELAAVRITQRRQRLLWSVTSMALAGLILAGFARPNRLPLTDKDGILHVRGVVVEDLNGVERVRLGAPLPDPLIDGVRHQRSGVVSGLLISDAKGNERGGYVTADKSGEAFLSLDSEDTQQSLFLVNPGGGIHFDLGDQQGNSASLSVFPNGPRLTPKRRKRRLWNCRRRCGKHGRASARVPTWHARGRALHCYLETGWSVSRLLMTRSMRP